MRTQDALNILGLHPNVTAEDIKKAYRAACFEYHPDRNAAGLEMMQAINAAYESLKDYASSSFQFQEDEINLNYGMEFNAAIKAAMGYGLEIEICGAWIWVSGDTKPAKDTLKNARYKWARKKVKWYFRPEKYRSRNRRSWDMGKIRETYGSRKVNEAGRQSSSGALAVR